MTKNAVEQQAQAKAFDLLRLAHESLSASLRFDYFSDGKGHKQSKAVLAPSAARRRVAPKQNEGGEEQESDQHRSEIGVEDYDASKADSSWDRALAEVDDDSIHPADITAKYLAEVAEKHRLTSSEEYRLARRTIDGDEDACRQLVEHHLGLVVMMARRYVNRGLPLLDLIEEGNLGLLTAARKFDPELGYRFSTYSKWWIREGIEMALMTQSRLVRVPVHLSRTARQTARKLNLQARAAAKTGEPMGEQALPADLVALLDDDDRDGSALLQDLPAGDEGQPEAALTATEQHSQMLSALGELTTKERTVIEGRFGLGREESRTLDAIGKELGLTCERVRQIEKEALVKLRGVFSTRGVTWDAIL